MFSSAFCGTCPSLRDHEGCQMRVHHRPQGCQMGADELRACSKHLGHVLQIYRTYDTIAPAATFKTTVKRLRGLVCHCWSARRPNSAGATLAAVTPSRNPVDSWTFHKKCGSRFNLRGKLTMMTTIMSKNTKKVGGGDIG